MEKKKMFMPNDCDVKQLFRNDFVDVVNRLVNGTDYYMFELYGNARSQGTNWYNQGIQNACSAREYLAFINALDKQIERDNICIVYGVTCDNACVWVVCAEQNFDAIHAALHAYGLSDFDPLSMCLETMQYTAVFIPLEETEQTSFGEIEG